MNINVSSISAGGLHLADGNLPLSGSRQGESFMGALDTDRMASHLRVAHGWTMAWRRHRHGHLGRLRRGKYIRRLRFRRICGGGSRGRGHAVAAGREGVARELASSFVFLVLRGEHFLVRFSRRGFQTLDQSCGRSHHGIDCPYGSAASRSAQTFSYLAGFILVPLSILLIRYFPVMGRAYSAWTGEAFNVGVATGKNGLGYVCLIFGLGSVWCIFSALKIGINRQTRGKLLANLMLLALTLWLFNMAHSATSFACFLIGGCLMFAISRRAIWRHPVFIHGMVAAVLFLVVYGLFLNPKAGLTEAVGRDSTLTGRTRIWNDVLRLTVNPVIGAGYESFWLGKRLEEIWLTNWEHPNQAHNGYLEVYLDLGWVGLTLIATMMIAGYRNAVRAVSRAPNLMSLKIAFLVVAILYNCTEHAFRELHPVWIMFLLAVITIPVSLRQEFE